ncbi:hypothetical protein [Hydrogenimonas thermophila]|uniref:mRNA interferase MazF n=1 Tax=Hydrogenimonas thermophila TaxID=223786 RepID=A0A1I5LK24_9BACT|nr:hypothetical protein [Hydrogenimonas thermophila]SFO97562.1 mRNA interferase MazF [Hydrogenimonas thermophila]
MPLTTNIAGGTIRVLIKKREHLEKDSEICVNELCTLDISRIDFSKILTVLTSDEMKELEMKIKVHLGL